MRILEVDSLAIDIPVAGGTLHAVRGVSFAVDKGETLCIVGESGCGKSLTAHALLGLTPKKARRTQNALSFAGHDLAGLSEKALNTLRGDRISMIFQDPMTSLNPSYPIGNLLEEVYRRHRGGSRAAARARAVEMLEKVGIPAARERLGQYPHQLSGGLRQRVMIAMALMCEPDVLIADEPTTALDVHVQVQILNLLADLQREMGLAIVLITHDLGLVARFADKVAVMYAGAIVESGPVGTVFRDPRHPYTRALLEAIPVPGKTEPGGLLGAIPGVVPSLVGEVTGCAFRDRCSYATPACARTVAHHEDGAHAFECNNPPPAGRWAA